MLPCSRPTYDVNHLPWKETLFDERADVIAYLMQPCAMREGSQVQER